jgi:hypothetical protein
MQMSRRPVSFELPEKIVAGLNWLPERRLLAKV